MKTKIGWAIGADMESIHFVEYVDDGAPREMTSVLKMGCKELASSWNVKEIFPTRSLAWDSLFAITLLEYDETFKNLQSALERLRFIGLLRYMGEYKR